MTPSSKFLAALVVVTFSLPTSPSLAQESYRPFTPQLPSGRAKLGQPGPDLVIIAATPAGVCSGPEAYIDVTVKIQNIGKGPAVMPEPLGWAPWVAVWDKGSQDLHLPGVVSWVASGAPSQLKPQETAIFKAGGYMRRVPGGDFTIGVQVDPQARILETNEANNFKTVHCK